MDTNATELSDEDLFAMYNTENKSFASTKNGIIIPQISAVISGLSSLLVIFVILRSRTKLSSTYHRILLCLSISDFVGSFAIALVTLPMPKPGSDRYIDSYNFEGKRIGNYTTCSAQSFLIYTSAFTSFVYHISLWVFYSCKIHYRMQTVTIVNYVEPFLHVFSIGIPMIFGLIVLLKGFFNVNTTRPFCSITIYPSLCTEKPYDEIVECINGTKEDTPLFSLLHKLLAICIGLGFVITFVLMILLVRTIFYEEKRFREVVEVYERMRANCTNTTSDNRAQASKSKLQHEQTKILTKECLSHLLFWFLTWISVILFLCGIQDRWVIVSNLMLTPLQGFWSFVVFCDGKIQIIRRCHHDSTYLKAFRLIFTSSDYPDVLFSNMTIIKRDENNSAQEYDDSISGISIESIPKVSSQSNPTGLSSGSNDLQSNLSLSLNNYSKASRSLSLNHLDSFNSSYDENTFDDKCGSNVNSNLSRMSNVSNGSSSNILSLFALNSNLCANVESYKKKGSSGESFFDEI